MSKFEVYEIESDRSLISGLEDEGRFFKYWIDRADLGRCLFKAATSFEEEISDRRMDWREKVAEQLGKLIGLPVAKTELALARLPQQKTISGSISLDYTPERATVMSLRDFLSQVDPDYDRYDLNLDEGYNVGNIIDRLAKIFVDIPLDWARIDGIKDGADVFVGYLLFDAWLGATDRHDENIEIAVLGNRYSLCPSFDHGDCLGSKLSSQERESKIFDRSQLTESCWWEKDREISTLEAFEIAARIRPQAAKMWLNRLANVDIIAISEVFDRLPDSLVEEYDIVFATELLEFNRNQIFDRLSSIIFAENSVAAEIEIDIELEISESLDYSPEN
jgi:hypothetical protein